MDRMKDEFPHFPPLKQRWSWSLVFEGEQELRGDTFGQDPREALSRLLTSEKDGVLFGEKHSIPIDVLHEAPGNADVTLTIKRDNFTLTITKDVADLL